MSFRLKTILGIAFIESVLLLTLIISGLSFFSDSNEEQFQQRINITSRLFTNATKDAILATDLAMLESFVKEILTDPDITYIKISNNSFVLAEGGDKAVLSQTRKADSNLQSVDDGIFDLHLSIEESNTQFGIIEIGLSTNVIEKLLSKAQKWAVSLATIEVILVAIFSFILGTYLTRQLQKLKKASNTISSEGPGHQINIMGNDEITDVAKAFNAMSHSLKKSYDELNQSLHLQKETLAISNRNQAKNTAILSASLDALITINSHGKVIEYNNVACQIFGWSRDEIINQPISQFIIPHDMREAHEKGMENFINTGEAFVLNQRLELSALHKQGHSFPIEIAISPIETNEETLFTAFIRDISNRHLSEQELKLAAKAFETSEAMFMADAEGNIIRTNSAFTKITGYEQEEVIGKNPRIFSSGKQGLTFYKKMWKEISTEGQWKGEIYNKRKNGDIFPEYLSISSVRDDNGVITHFIAHLIDISQQKENEEILKIAHKEAEKSNIAKSHFLATMSHEIRTPMNAVLGILGLLRDTSLTKQQMKLVKTGRDSGELLLTIINDILDFTKMEVDKLTLEKFNFNLHELLRNCVLLLENMARVKGIDLNLVINDDVPCYANGDPDRIRQILINLINNAIKFTEKGKITVTTSSKQCTSTFFTLTCDVQDSGIGIPAESQSILFDEFTMADQSHTRHYEGTGLGLAICKRLVHLMDGDINFTSQQSVGSTFTFNINLSIVDQADFHDSVTEEVFEVPNPGTRILLAEDNPANQFIIKAILEKENLIIDTVSNGLEAVDAIRHIPYDIILMDISMPVMDGMTATKEIRKLAGSASTIPIIALTAHSLSGDKERFLAAGMDDYLTKPIDKESTLFCIARWTMGATATLNTDEIEPENKIIQLPESDLVSERVLQQLVKDTDAEIVPELLTLYIEDAKKRMLIINLAIKDKNIKTLEFETHTLGSSAAAHSNLALCTLSREIEDLCQSNLDLQAYEKASILHNVAEESFDLLNKRIQQGFTSSI